MKKFSKGHHSSLNELNITPLLDLAFVLLVIFIIMTTASVQGAKVDLPKASATQSLAQPKTKVIAVSNDGHISLDAIPVSLSELDRKLRDAKAIQPDLPIIIKGDRATQYQRIMDVLDLCGRVGISSVGLAAQRTVGS